jgi:hypothetical protein
MFVYLTKTTIAESSVKHQKSINQSINQSKTTTNQLSLYAQLQLISFVHIVVVIVL